jgi:hypothetical protein
MPVPIIAESSNIYTSNFAFLGASPEFVIHEKGIQKQNNCSFSIGSEEGDLIKGELSLLYDSIGHFSAIFHYTCKLKLNCDIIINYYYL